MQKSYTVEMTPEQRAHIFKIFDEYLYMIEEKMSDTGTNTHLTEAITNFLHGKHLEARELKKLFLDAREIYNHDSDGVSHD
jgi:hypothetical protein